MADATRHATGLVVNTLTLASGRGEAVDHWLWRNGLEARLFGGLSCSLLTECGVPFADRHDRFSGMTFALLDIQLPVGMALPSPLTDGLEFGLSQSRFPNGPLFQQRFIKVWEGRLQFASPLPATREGWPLPLARVLACLPAVQSNAVVDVLRVAVDVKCNSLADAGGQDSDPALKRHKRTWTKIQALVQAIEQSRQMRGDDEQSNEAPPSTRIIPLHWSTPESLPATDCCRVDMDPGMWLAQGCEAESGIWVLRPGLPIPPDSWVPAVLHAVKGRLLNTLLAQRAVPQHRMLRGHVSSKMATVFWVSCSAATREQPQAAGEEGTWRHCLMWRITIHQLRALPENSSPADVWQAGTSWSVRLARVAGPGA